MDEVTKALVSQGGFAVLAAFFAYLSYEGAQMWVADVRSAGERERAILLASSEREKQLVDRVLVLSTQMAESLATLTSSINSLKSEQEALRAHFHAFRNALAQMHLEMDAERSGGSQTK